ncbi:hypothetical protein ACWD0Z_38890, partial [Streptomyces sp. NPDC003007]
MPRLPMGSGFEPQGPQPGAQPQGQTEAPAGSPASPTAVPNIPVSGYQAQWTPQAPDAPEAPATPPATPPAAPEAPTAPDVSADPVADDAEEPGAGDLESGATMRFSAVALQRDIEERAAAQAVSTADAPEVPGVVGDGDTESKDADGADSGTRTDEAEDDTSDTVSEYALDADAFADVPPAEESESASTRSEAEGVASGLPEPQVAASEDTPSEEADVQDSAPDDTGAEGTGSEEADPEDARPKADEPLDAVPAEAEHQPRPQPQESEDAGAATAEPVDSQASGAPLADAEPVSAEPADAVPSDAQPSDAEPVDSVPQDSVHEDAAGPGTGDAQPAWAPPAPQGVPPLPPSYQPAAPAPASHWPAQPQAQPAA